MSSWIGKMMQDSQAILTSYLWQLEKVDTHIYVKLLWKAI